MSLRNGLLVGLLGCIGALVFLLIPQQEPLAQSALRGEIIPVSVTPTPPLVRIQSKTAPIQLVLPAGEFLGRLRSRSASDATLSPALDGLRATIEQRLLTADDIDITDLIDSLHTTAAERDVRLVIAALLDDGAVSGFNLSTKRYINAMLKMTSYINSEGIQTHQYYFGKDVLAWEQSILIPQSSSSPK